MKPLALIVMLCLSAGFAHATFELKDPAQIIVDEQNKAEMEASEQDEAAANDTPGEGANKAVGDTACSEYVSFWYGRSQQYASSQYWIQGFIDGAGYQRSKTVGDFHVNTDHELDSIASWIENYCRENPSNKLAQAVAVFIEEHRARH